MAQPRFDRTKRRRYLRQLRAEQSRHYASLTPDERLDRVEALMWLASGQGTPIGRDESLELLLSMKRRLRAASRTHD